MHRAENVNAPSLGGFVIGGAAGLVGFAVLVVLGDFDLFPAAAMAGVVATVVGMILGLPWGTSEPAVYLDFSAKGHAAAAAPVAALAGPLRLSAPRNGVADDLKQLEGVGPAMEKLVNEMGFYHFDQIAAWTDAEIAWVDENLEGFKGRVSRDEWVRQAQEFVKEREDKTS